MGVAATTGPASHAHREGAPQSRAMEGAAAATISQAANCGSAAR